MGDWTNNWPGALNSTTNMPDQTDGVDTAHSSTIESLRDAQLSNEALLGKTPAPAAGTLRERLDHNIQDDASGQFVTVTEKTSPDAADLVLLEDSGATYAKRRTTVGNLVSYAVPGYQLSSYADLPAALTAIGANEATLIIDADDTIASNVTVPANVSLSWIRGFVLTVNNTFTLTINGDIVAAAYEIFDVSPGGDVVFGSKQADIELEWFGVTGDGSTDDTTTMQYCMDCAIASVQSGGKAPAVRAQPGSTYVITMVNIAAGLTLDFRGAIVTRPNSAGNWVRTFTTQNNLYNNAADSAPLIIRNMIIDGNRANQGTYTGYELEQSPLLFLVADTAAAGRMVVHIEDVVLRESVSDGIHVRQNVLFRADRVQAINCFRGGITATGGYSKLQVANFESGGDVHATSFNVEPDAVGYGTTFRVDVQLQNVFAGGAFDIAIPDGGTLVADNLTMTGPGWALGGAGVAGQDPSKISMTNCTLIAGTESATFNRVRTPGDATFTNCTFIADASEVGDITANAFRLYYGTGAPDAHELNQSTRFVGCTFKVSGGEAADTLYGLVIEADLFSSNNRTAVIGCEFPSALFDNAINLKQGGYISIDDCYVNCNASSSAIRLGNSSTYDFDATIGDVRIGPDALGYLLINTYTPNTTLRHYGTTMDEGHLVYTTYGLLDKNLQPVNGINYEGGRLIMGDDDPVGMTGITGDRYRKRLSGGDALQEWVCVQAGLTTQAVWKQVVDTQAEEVLTAYASLSAAITAVGSTETTLIVNRDETISANVTVPSNITLRFTRGSVLSVDNTYTLTIEGIINAGPYEIFDTSAGGSISLLGSNNREVLPEWFGAFGGDATDDAAAIAEADTVAAGAAIPLVFSPANYIVASSQTLTSDLVFPRSATLWLSDTVVLTINGTITAEEERIFYLYGSGVPVFGTNQRTVRSSWFDGASDCQWNAVRIAIGTTYSGTIVVDSTVDADTVGDNLNKVVSLEVEPTGSIVVALGVTFVLNGPLEAGPYQIFDTTAGGTVSFGNENNTPSVNPKWFGAEGDNSTNDAVAVDEADSVAAAAGIPLVFSPGIYVMGQATTLTAELVFLQGANLRADTAVTTINGPITAGPYLVLDENSGTFDLSASDYRDVEVWWFESLTRACAILGTTLDAVIRFSRDTFYSSTYTVPANITLKFTGGRLGASNSHTVTISGPIDAPPQEIFDATSSNRVAFSTTAPVEALLARWYGVTGDGSTADNNDINACNTEAVAAGKPIKFTGGSYFINNASVTLTAKVVFEPGASLQPNTGYSYTLQNLIDAGPYQIFDASSGGTFSFSSGTQREFLPEWFGAVADGSTNDGFVIDACDVAAAAVGGFSHFTSGNYYINTSITLTALLIIDSGAELAPNTGETVVINGPVIAGPYQIFDTSNGGTVTLGDVSHERYDEWFDDDTPWSSKRIGSHGEAYEVRTVKTELTALSGATATWSNAIPAGSEVLGVSARVTTLITGATTFDIGDGTDVDRWGAGIALGAGVTTDLSDMTDFTRHVYASATSIVLTANVSNFTAGAVRLVLHYRQLTAPTS